MVCRVIILGGEFELEGKGKQSIDDGRDVATAVDFECAALGGC